MDVSQALDDILSKGTIKSAARQIRFIDVTCPYLLPELLTRLQKLAQSSHPSAIVRPSIDIIQELMRQRLTSTDRLLSILESWLTINHDDREAIVCQLQSTTDNSADELDAVQTVLAGPNLGLQAGEAALWQLVKISADVKVAAADRHQAGYVAWLTFERLLQDDPPAKTALRWLRWFYPSALAESFLSAMAEVFYRFVETACDQGKDVWATLFDHWIESFVSPPSPLAFLPLVGLGRWALREPARAIGFLGHWSLLLTNPKSKDQAVAPLLSAILNDTDIARYEGLTQGYTLYQLFAQVLQFLVTHQQNIASWAIIASIKRLLYYTEGDDGVLLIVLLLNALSLLARTQSDEATLVVANTIKDLVLSVKGQEGGRFWVDLVNHSATGRHEVVRQAPPLKNLDNLVEFRPQDKVSFILTAVDGQRFIPGIPVDNELSDWANHYRDLLMNFGSLLIHGQAGQPGLRQRRRDIAKTGDLCLVDNDLILSLGLTEIIVEPGDRSIDEIARLGFVFQTHTLIRYSLRFKRRLSPEGTTEWILVEDEVLGHPHGLIFTLTGLSFLHDLLVGQAAAAVGIARQRHPQTGGPATTVEVAKDQLRLTTRPYWIALPSRQGTIPAMLPQLVAEIIARDGRLPDPPLTHHDQPWPPVGSPTFRPRIVSFGQQKVSYDCPIGWSYVRGRTYQARRPRRSGIYPRYAYIQGQSTLAQLGQLLSLTFPTPP